ncbi:MAG TPA: hypothetical protein VGE36_13760 [Roseateles sp.]
MTDQTEKRAPVQGYPGGIPWAIHLEAYAVYCQRWGAQPAMIDLEGRNCRGGFSTGELDDFIPGWRDRVSEFGLLKAEVLALRAELSALKSAPIRVLTEHSGCGQGAQVDQLSVTLHPGDKVVLQMGKYSAALAAKA